MQLNRFLGFHLKEAMEVFLNEGYLVDEVNLITPPLQENLLCSMGRIVRIDEKENKVLRILVC